MHVINIIFERFNGYVLYHCGAGMWVFGHVTEAYEQCVRAQIGILPLVRNLWGNEIQFYALNCLLFILQIQPFEEVNPMIYMPREIANRPCTFTRSIYLWIVHIESKGNICHIFFKLKKKINLMLATVCNVYIHLRFLVAKHVNWKKKL